MLKRRARGERGATAVEFALVMIPFMILVLGMIQYGWYFFVSQSTGSASSNVARRLAVGDCWIGTEAEAFAKNQGIAVTGVKVTDAANAPAVLGTNVDIGDAFIVTVKSNASIIGFLPMPNGGEVARTVETRLEDDSPDTACS